MVGVLAFHHLLEGGGFPRAGVSRPKGDEIRGGMCQRQWKVKPSEAINGVDTVQILTVLSDTMSQPRNVKPKKNGLF
jgi:hypothetical protein